MRAVGVVMALWLAACGGRSRLDEGTFPAGSGGAPSTGSSSISSSSSTSSTTSSTTSTSSTSSTSSSGSGGAPPVCNSLVLSGEPITYEATPGKDGSRPIVVPAADDGSLVSVVFAQTPVESPTVPPTAVASASFAPWGAWPSTLGPVVQVFPFGGDAFAASAALSAEQPGYSVLVHFPNDTAPTPTVVATAAAGQSYDVYPPLLTWDTWEPTWGTALARGANGHLAAYEEGFGSDAFLSVALTDEATKSAAVISDVACANARFPAAAVEVSGGHLLATAAGRKFGGCLLDDGIPGPAKDLQVIRVDQAKQEVSLAASFEGTDPLTHVALARRGGGAWVVWQENGASAFTPPPIAIARLDESGAMAGSVLTIPETTGTSGPFAAAALGPLLAVAWVDAIDPSTPTLRIGVFDETGNLVTSNAIDTAPSWLYEPSLSLLASPDGTQLLLAWADQAAPEQAMVRVARFFCSSVGE